MSNYNRFLIAATDITAQPKLFGRFRGKTAKEVYRLTKGIIVTRSFIKPVAFAVTTIPREVAEGFVQSKLKSVDETILGYFGFISFVRWLYMSTDSNTIKETARIIYNLSCTPIIGFNQGITSMCDLIQLTKFEKWWFGSPVYVFNDERLWLEGNLITQEVITHFKNGDEL